MTTWVVPPCPPDQTVVLLGAPHRRWEGRRSPRLSYPRQAPRGSRRPTRISPWRSLLKYLSTARASLGMPRWRRALGPGERMRHLGRPRPLMSDQWTDPSIARWSGRAPRPRATPLQAEPARAARWPRRVLAPVQKRPQPRCSPALRSSHPAAFRSTPRRRLHTRALLARRSIPRNRRSGTKAPERNHPIREHRSSRGVAKLRWTWRWRTRRRPRLPLSRRCRAFFRPLRFPRAPALLMNAPVSRAFARFPEVDPRSHCSSLRPPLPDASSGTWPAEEKLA